MAVPTCANQSNRAKRRASVRYNRFKVSQLQENRRCDPMELEQPGREHGRLNSSRIWRWRLYTAKLMTIQLQL
jgi:hypothetical protein